MRQVTTFKTTLLIILWALFFFSYPSFSAQKQEITIAYSDWQNFSEGDGKGYFFDLVKHIYPDHEYIINLKKLPLLRTVQWAAGGKADIVPGVYLNPDSPLYFSKYPVLIETLDLATRDKGIEEITNNPHNKRIGSLIGMTLGYLLPKEVEYIEFTDYTSMIKMLHNKRLDGVIGIQDDFITISKKLDIPVHISLGIVKIPLLVAFAKTPKGHRLKARFDQELARMIKEGAIKKILDKYQPFFSVAHYPFTQDNGEYTPIESDTKNNNQFYHLNQSLKDIEH